MIALWLAAGVLGGSPVVEVPQDVVVRGGDDTPPARRREVIYVWPDRQREAERAIKVVQSAVDRPAFTPSPAITEAVANLLGRVSSSAPASDISTALDAAMAAINSAEMHRAFIAKARAMQRITMAAVQAKADDDLLMIGIAMAIAA
jgi:hypothetical protein